MCAHNGTHIDAPSHFIENGTAVDSVPLSKTVGYAYVAEFEGELSASDAKAIIERARRAEPESANRLLIKGGVIVTAESAKVLADEGIYLVGNESQTVGPEDSPMQVHKILLSAEIVLLEGIRLSGIAEGVYFLSAAPINLAGSDGAPCRAILIGD